MMMKRNQRATSKTRPSFSTLHGKVHGSAIRKRKDYMSMTCLEGLAGVCFLKEEHGSMASEETTGLLEQRLLNRLNQSRDVWP